ncbi:FAD-dependent monooxygenase [Streptomyces fructofermentans]|uniref:FAD-dependent monooxygenase n=1 Tax=Streptomyces fructofermentans TaxID=152141 RepID=UPI0033E1FB38
MRRAARTGGLRVAVVGGGIGGLTLAAALRTLGVSCLIFEQAREFATTGAGVQLAPNAVRPLHRLGLSDALGEHAVRIDAIEFRNREGGGIARTELGSECEELFGAPYYAVHRGQLHRALYDLVGPDDLRTGRRLVRTEESADRVRLTFQDGSVHEADAVVGSDGIHSVVRDTLRRDSPVFSGLSAFRGLVPVDRLPPTARRPLVRLWLGAGGHFVAYPVAAGRLLSFTAVSALGAGTGESWSARADPAVVRAAFEGWDEAVGDILRGAREVGRWALHDREPLATWSTGRLTLLGDAAHPMLPFMAQGANQAVEDAMDLAACLADAGPDSVRAALRRYESLRVPRTTAIQSGSRGSAAAMHLADGPEQRARDEAMRQGAALHHRAWLYAYDTAGGGRGRA